MLNKNNGEKETQIQEVQIKPEVSPQETQIIPTKIEEKKIESKITETPMKKSSKFESKTLTLEIPSDWQIKSKECKDGDCSSLTLTKDLYELKINTDPMLTGGGFGGVFDGICSPTNQVVTNITSNLQKTDEYFDLISNNSCMKDSQLNAEQSGTFWGGSKYMTKGSDIPAITCNNCGEQNQMLITYSYDFLTQIDGSIDPGKTRLLPLKNSEELTKHLAEMDEIVKSIEFKK
jgi:hypothetical protein